MQYNAKKLAAAITQTASFETQSMLRSGMEAKTGPTIWFEEDRRCQPQQRKAPANHASAWIASMADNRIDKGMIAPTEHTKRIPEDPDVGADEALRRRIDALERDRDVDRRTWNRIFKIGGTIGALITFLIMLLSFVADQVDKLR